MTREDAILGTVTGEDTTFEGTAEIRFGGQMYKIDLMIEADLASELSEIREAYQRFMACWDRLQSQTLAALLAYYNDERFSCGPDDEAARKLWWPEYKTTAAFAETLTPETLVLRADWEQQGSRRVYLLFSRTWGGPDWDDNGVAVAFVNEAIAQAGDKSIAF